MLTEFTHDYFEAITTTWIACGLVASIAVAIILRDRSRFN